MVDPAELRDASATLDGVRGVATRARELERGAVVGRYVLLAPVGAGGMGLVFAAHDPELDRKVALKVLRSDVPRTGASEGRRKLLREAQALARLAHPNVVSVHDVGVHEGRSFIAMEFIVGQTLRQWLDRRPRSEREVIDVFLAAGRGLAAAHAAGVVHGDVKPHNVLIADDGRVLVTDFGLARLLDTAAPASAFEETAGRVSTDALAMTATDLGEAAGTPAYMAPEQFADAPNGGATAASDQFGFAVALWEGLAGRRPFQGDSLPALVAAMMSGRIDDASAAKIPRWLRPALRRALAANPALRHASLDPLLAAMASDPRRVRRRLAIVGGVAAIGLAGAATWWWSRYSAHQACAEQAETIAGLVDEGSQARIRAAFVDTGSAIATEAADEAERALSEYAGTWSNASRANCDAHVDGDRSDADFARAQSCLDDARVALTELVASSSAHPTPLRSPPWPARSCRCRCSPCATTTLSSRGDSHSPRRPRAGTASSSSGDGS
jgi:predicted Ser/Thr protein kinase